MKKTVCLILSIVFVLVCIVGCSENDNLISSDLSEIVDKACSVVDYSSLSFTYMQDEYSDEILMYMYGIEDESIIESVADFVLSQRSGMYAATFAVIQFKDGTDSSVISEAEASITDFYVNSLITALMPYNPEQTAFAQKYEFKTYGNSLVLVISENNEAVFDAIS